MLSIPKYPEQYAQHFPTIFYLLCCASQHHVGYAMPLDVLHCWLSDSRNDSHWTGCVIAHEHHPQLAL